MQQTEHLLPQNEYKNRQLHFATAYLLYPTAIVRTSSTDKFASSAISS